MEIHEKKKPTSFREWLAMKLVRLAQRIYPKSEAVLAFYSQLLHDEMIHGKSVVRVAPDSLYGCKVGPEDPGHDFWGEGEAVLGQKPMSTAEEINIKNGR